MTAPRIDTGERRRRIGRRHRLAATARPGRVEEIARSLIALHSSDPVSVHLSVIARRPDATIEEVERALYGDRTLLRHHAMRRTLWVTTLEDAMLVHDAFTRKIAAAERARLLKAAQRDHAWLDDAIAEVVALLDDHPGGLSTREIGRRLPELTEPVVLAAGTKWETAAPGHTRFTIQAAFEGRIVRARPAGSWINGQYAWSTPREWAELVWGAHSEIDAATAVVERWLAAFGPGTLDDLVWWAGGTKRMVRTALETLGAVAVELDDASEPGWVLAGDLAATPDPGPWVALLPGLDPTAMGWKQRGWYLPAAVDRRVTDRWGNIGPTIWADGQVVGGWVQRPDGSIATELVAPLDRRHRGLLADEIERLVATLGDARFRVRFPSPNQPELLG